MMKHILSFSGILYTLLLLLASAPAHADFSIDVTNMAEDDTCYYNDTNQPVTDGYLSSLDIKKEAIRQSKSGAPPKQLAEEQIRVLDGFIMWNPGWRKCTADNSITFCYSPLSNITVTSTEPLAATATIRSTCSAANIKTVTLAEVTDTANNPFILNGALFQVVKINGNLCVQYHTGGKSGWLTMGCRPLPSPAPIAIASLINTCYVGTSCYHEAQRASKNLLSMSGVIVQCFQDTLYKIFDDVQSCPERNNMFVTFKNALRKAVTLALTLYVIFFGIKIVLGTEIPEKGEVFKFILKMALVMYFALGDGIQQDLYPAFTGAARSLAQMMFDAAGARGLCNFESASYAGHADLSLWDAFDCRLLYYFGIYNTIVINQIIAAGGLVFSAIMTPPLIAILLPLLLALQLLPLVFSIIFAVFLLSVALYVVHVYIIALISITLLLLIAPLIIPMALFTVTKTYYDNWLRMMISFTLQPMVLFAFMGLMMSVMDKIYYGTCHFKRVGVPEFPLFLLTTDAVTVRGHTFPALEGKDLEACKESFGYQMDVIARAIADGPGETIDAIFFSFHILVPVGTGANLWSGLFTLSIFLFFFYHVAGMLQFLLQDLTGSVSLGGMATSPTNAIDKAKEKAKDVVASAIGKRAKSNAARSRTAPPDAPGVGGG
jgi:type IV secretion system protein VirB6